MKKTKKQKKRHFCFCFFAVTFLSFNRSPRSWSRKVTGSSSNRTQQTAIENSEGFGSYEEKTNQKNKKTKKKDIFVFVFCYNFSVFPTISMFLVSKNHARRQQPFEAKNTQKLPRVRKLFAFKDQKRVEKRLKTVIVPSPELQLCRELWVAACPRPATQSSP